VAKHPSDRSFRPRHDLVGVLDQGEAPRSGALHLLLVMPGELLVEIGVLEHGVLLDGSLYPYTPL